MTTRTPLLPLAAAALLAACAQHLIPANGTTPLPDGVYRFAEHPEGAEPIVGTVTIVGDSIAVETDKRCPTDYARDGHGMVMRCDAFTLTVGNDAGRWSIGYATTRVSRVRHQSCADWQMGSAGQMICKRYQIEYVSENIPVTGVVRLIPAEPRGRGGN